MRMVSLQTDRLNSGLDFNGVPPGEKIRCYGKRFYQKGQQQLPMDPRLDTFRLHHVESAHS